MFDPVTTNEIVRFLIAIALGCLSYSLATLLAWIISPVPRHVYFGRLIFLALFFLLIWVGYLPSTARAWSGPRERYYELRMEERGMGTAYGIQAIWIWPVLALLKWRKIRPDDGARH